MICNAHEHSHKILELFALKFSNSNTIKLHLVSSTQYIYIYIFFLLKVNFDKSTVSLNFLLIPRWPKINNYVIY